MTEYRTILADPPWQERGGGKYKRGADRHYPLMTLRDIARTIWTCPLFTPAEDSHLYLWVTNNYLPKGIELLRSLGFRYVTNTCWVKMADRVCKKDTSIDEFLDAVRVANENLQIGLGQYQRGAHELLLFGARGKAMVPEPGSRLPSVVFAPRGKHSEKPTIFYERIEQISPNPRLELFARNRRNGWDSWGNEVGDA